VVRHDRRNQHRYFWIVTGWDDGLDEHEFLLRNGSVGAELYGSYGIGRLVTCLKYLKP
jgi:hypothetical protein